MAQWKCEKCWQEFEGINVDEEGTERIPEHDCKEHPARLGFVKDDGGRKEAGYKGLAGDCGARAIAIATGKPYQEVYDRLTELLQEYVKNSSSQQAKWYKAKKSRTATARDGMPKKIFEKYLVGELGWKWTATMKIGSGCQVHLRKDELPDAERLIARVSKHYVAIIDGAIRDTHRPDREGTRCVYGYWLLPEE